MLSMNVIRENPELVQISAENKGEKVDINKVLDLDSKHRVMLTKLNDLRAEKNIASEQIGIAKKKGDDASAAIKNMQELSKKIKDIENSIENVISELEPLLLWIPNTPHKSVPVGKKSTDNQTIRTYGNVIESNFKLLNHLELGERLGLFDLKRGANIAGSGFPLYTGKGAKLERSLINYMLDYHTNNFGYTEVFPPFASRGVSMMTTAQIPKLQEDMYHIEKDDLYLIPTAEVPLTNIHQNEIIDGETLPKNYAAYSACFRREAGSYGKDTHGLIRLHQFNKVELVKFVKPETSYDELENLTKQAEDILQSLGLHYRVLALCIGDLSFASAKSYDLEVWAPGEQQWLEVSTCSNFESFQARRGKIRYRDPITKNVDFVHTLNGSGVATPRLLIALLETYQQSDGSIKIPEPLQPYYGADKLE